MSALPVLLKDLAIAYRVLAHYDVLDGHGSVSVRHPERQDRFFIARQRTPEKVTIEDLIELDLEGRPAGASVYVPPVEAAIHAAVYQRREDVRSVVHNHAHDVLPFAAQSGPRLRPVSHTAAICGPETPVWDGGAGLVTDVGAARDLAAGLGEGTTVILRGHGALIAGVSIYHAVHTTIYLSVNAQILTEALQMGDVIYMSPGEIEKMTHAQIHGGSLGPKSRTWEFWSAEARAL